MFHVKQFNKLKLSFYDTSNTRLSLELKVEPSYMCWNLAKIRGNNLAKERQILWVKAFDKSGDLW